jgi:hypothetical protein
MEVREIGGLDWLADSPVKDQGVRFHDMDGDRAR